MNQLKVFTAFSGYDSQCMALDRLGINYDLVGWSEIDKYAIQAHNAVYPQYAGRNFGDISIIDWPAVPDFDLFTYSFPCQDISNAGAQRGLEEGSGTRSSLLWECRKAIEAKRPKYLLMENVKALTSKKFLPYLNKWGEYLEGLGYKNFTQVLNAKNYGVPQNRERVFMVSVLDPAAVFTFPDSMKTDSRLESILENEVDEKYYLRKEVVASMQEHCRRKQAEGCGFKTEFRTKDDIATCISTRYGGRQTDTYLKESYRNQRLQKLVDSGEINPNAITYLDSYNQTTSETTAGTITTRVSASNSTFISEPANLRVPQATKKGYAEVEPGGVFDGSYPNSKTRRGRVQDGGRTSPTITAGGDTPNVYEGGQGDEARIRKFTEREVFRLMGVSDKNIDKFRDAGISRAQQYKLAGNSIVVDVLYYIFKNLLSGVEISADNLLDDIEAWEDM